MKKNLLMIIISIICVAVLSVGSVFANFEKLNPDMTNGESGNAAWVESAAGIANPILGAMQWIGYAIAVGMLIYVGIKYVMASANEKADLKQSLIKYVIGAVLIAGAVTIAGWIIGVGQM